MKILCISDVHGDAVTNGIRRFEECERQMTTALGAALKEKVDLFAFLGDLTDPDSGPIVFSCVELVLFVARALERHGIASVWLAGNHDVIEDGSGKTTIDPLYALAGGDGLVTVATQPRTFRKGLVNGSGGIMGLCLPFVAAARADATPGARSPTRAPSASPYEEIIAGTKGFDGRLVVFSHLTPRGIIPGEETTEMPRGRDILLPDEAIVEAARGKQVLVLNGHIHKRQRHVTPSGLPVEVVGAASVFSHGEERHRPGYLIVEVDT